MRNRITFENGTVLTDADFIGGVNYFQDLCGDTDIVIGSILQQQIKFNIRYDEATAQSLVGCRGLWEVQWMNESNWNKKGYFTVTEAVKIDKVSSALVAYDDFIRAEVIIDDMLETKQFTLPTTLKQHFYEILAKAELRYDGQIKISYGSLNFGNNANFTVKDNYRATDLTAKQVLSYIAQVVGGMLYFDNDGKLCLNYIGSKLINFNLNNTQYRKFTRALFEVQPINWLIVQANEDDYGVQAFDTNRVRDNVYKITNNPLFYAESTEEIQQAVNNLYSRINNIVYTPATVSIFKDYDAKCGDYFTVDDCKMLITSKRITASGVELISSGNMWRETTGEELNPSIIALRGKTNELYRDLEETRLTIKDNYLNLESQIKQTADSITMSVDQDGATASITIGGDTFTAISEDGLEEKVGSIVMKGYVTFEGLADGTTTIDGSCIKTGTIDADRINMNGAISWSDLDSDLQTTINEKSDSDTELPDYIKDTYIDGATIKSPTIEGNTINMYGGVFNIKDKTGQSTYGYIGKGSGYAGNDTHTDGIIMGASAGSTNLGNGNYYFIATDSGVRMQGGSNAIYVTDSGVFKKINGTNSALGMAVFG